MNNLKALAWVAIVAGLAVGVAGMAGYPVDQYASVEWVYGASKPAKVIVVRESANAIKLTKEQIAWIGSPTLRADCKKNGSVFLAVDPDVVDATGKTPIELLPAITLAKKKGLPRLILVGPRGGLTDFVLPVDEAAARKRMGI